MTELKHVKVKVRTVLATKKHTRNNDNALTAEYIKRFYKQHVYRDRSGNLVVRLKDFKKLPTLESIRRCRAIIQNVNKQYLPTDAKVRKARRIKEKTYHNVEVREANKA